MKKNKTILKIILPFILAFGVFYMVYSKLNLEWSDVKKLISNGLNYEWLLLSLLLSIISNIIRGLRWYQLTEPVAPGGRKLVTILSIYVAYAGNLLVLRAGEVMRCGILRKKDNLSFTKTLGTVITERVFDAILLLIFIVIAFFIQLSFFLNFFHDNPDSLLALESKILNIKNLYIMILVLIGFVGFYYLLKKSSFFYNVKDTLKRLWEGMLSIKQVKKPIKFIIYTCFIWILYFLMFYIGKYFFSFEMPLGIIPMFSGFVMGSLGVLAPVQAGIGAYHFMVIYTLVFYGIDPTQAGVFAFVVFGLQMVVTLLTGFIAYIWLSFIKDKEQA